MIYRTIIFIAFFTLSAIQIVWYEALAISLFFYFLLDLILSIGKRIPFLEIIIVYAFLTWLLMPVVTYQVFNEYNDLSVLWVTYMTIPAEEYFGYVLPAAIMFALGLKVPLIGNNWSMTRYNDNLKQYLSNKSNLGIYLIAVGFFSNFLVDIAPEALRNIVNNFVYLSYVGMFYVIYSPFRHKTAIVLFCAGLTIMQSIASGMYGQLVFLSAMSSLILLAGKQIKLVYKLLVVAGGVFLVMFIQSIKTEYREGTWSGLERSADPALFGQLVWERITNPSEIYQPERLFNLSVRANQGNIVSKVMAYVPKFAEHAHGETIIAAIGAALVPRFLWPDKPRAGGADMVCKYLGDCHAASRGVSYNVGPIGESYINFGRNGGIVFMFFYGLFFNYIFNKALAISKRVPSLILWFPLIFTSLFTMENDILSFINTFIKSALFTYVMYRLVKLVFKSDL